MAENKTRPTEVSVNDFLAGVEPPERRTDSEKMLAMMQEITQQPPRMWGPTMVGFGEHHYRYETGREGDTFIVGFSPRKASLTLYFNNGLEPHAERLARLGKHKTGKACLYINRLKDVDESVLREMIQAAYEGA
jgi:hypothetical protein